MADVHEVASLRGRIGSVVKDKWRIDSRLGTGGMASVYAATHRNGNRVAIKMLHGELSKRPEVRARFLREGYVANAVNHPGAVRVLDDDVTEDGSVFLVMELLEGESVEARRERGGGTLPLGDVFVIADQLLSALAAAHEKGIVHRDVKPENVFITREGVVKILDFGIARMKGGGLGETTRSGLMLGTPAFMSPEQACGKPDEVDAKSDLWSVGATLFTLLSGDSVHAGDSPTGHIFATSTMQARSLAEVAPHLPAPLIKVIDCALEFDKTKRWRDAIAMRDALRWARNAISNVVDPDSITVLAVPRARENSVHDATPAHDPDRVTDLAVASSDAVVIESKPTISVAPAPGRGERRREERHDAGATPLRLAESALVLSPSRSASSMERESFPSVHPAPRLSMPSFSAMDAVTSEPPRRHVARTVAALVAVALVGVATGAGVRHFARASAVEADRDHDRDHDREARDDVDAPRAESAVSVANAAPRASAAPAAVDVGTKGTAHEPAPIVDVALPIAAAAPGRRPIEMDTAVAPETPMIEIPTEDPPKAPRRAPPVVVAKKVEPPRAPPVDIGSSPSSDDSEEPQKNAGSDVVAPSASAAHAADALNATNGARARADAGVEPASADGPVADAGATADPAAHAASSSSAAPSPSPSPSASASSRAAAPNPPDAREGDAVAPSASRAGDASAAAPAQDEL